jgi:divalent metal cation (Fe/Co/Zn/Cd) transporter
MVGIVLTAVSLVVMPFLGWVNLRAATALRSGALRADAYETIACSWLSLTTLAGLVRLAGGGPTRWRRWPSSPSWSGRGLRGCAASATIQTETLPGDRLA